MSFVVYKVAKRQFLIPTLRFSFVNIIPPALDTYLHLHYTLKRRPVGQSLTVPKKQCCAANRLENYCQFFPTLQRDNTATGLSEFTQQWKTYSLPLSIRLIIMPSALLSFKHPCFSFQTDNLESCGNKEDAIAQKQNSNRSIEVCQDSSIGWNKSQKDVNLRGPVQSFTPYLCRAILNITLARWCEKNGVGVEVGVG